MIHGKKLAMVLILTSIMLSSTLVFLLIGSVHFTPVDPAKDAQEHIKKITTIYARQMAFRLGRTESVVQAMEKFAELIYKDSHYLFSMKKDAIQNMDSKNLREIKKAFDANDIPLSSSSTIEIEKKGRRWRIEDKEKKKHYTIVNSGNKIEIYQTTLPPIPSYYHEKGVPGQLTPSDCYHDSKYKRWISPNASSFKIAPKAFTKDYQETYLKVIKEQEDPLYKVDPLVANEILDMAKMDILWKPLHRSYPEHLWLYMGFESGHHRSFPWHESIERSFDPRTRPWYDGAKISAISWSWPYVDVTGMGIMITVSKAVIVKGKCMGVVAADLSLTGLVKDLEQNKITPNSYNFLFDSNGITVIHPHLWKKSAGQNWQSTAMRIPIEQLEVSSLPFVQMKDMAIHGIPSVDLVSYGEQVRVVAMAPITKTPLCLASVVPLNEFLHQKSKLEQGCPSFHPWKLGLYTGIFFGFILFFLFPRLLRKSFATAISFLLIVPGLGVFSGSLVGMGVCYYQNTTLEKRYIQHTQENLHQQAIEHGKTLDMFFYQIESVVNTMGAFAKETWKKGIPSERPNFFHNPEVMGVIPGFKESQKHHLKISLDHSCFKLAPSAYHDKSSYLILPESSTYWKWPESVQKNIELSANMDSIFIPMYCAMEEILWVYMGTEEGVVRIYPYHGPLDKTYDPRIRPWYLAAMGASHEEVVFTPPFVDASTGKVIISAALKVENSKGEKIGVIGTDFFLESIQKFVLSTEVPPFGRTFLINHEMDVIAHPSHTLPSSEWQEKDIHVPITKWETKNPKLLSLLKQANKGKPVSAVIDYGGSKGKHWVSLVPLQRTSLILGQAIPCSEIGKSFSFSVYGQKGFLLALFNILFVVCLLFFWRK